MNEGGTFRAFVGTKWTEIDYYSLYYSRVFVICSNSVQVMASDRSDRCLVHSAFRVWSYRFFKSWNQSVYNLSSVFIAATCLLISITVSSFILLNAIIVSVMYNVHFGGRNYLQFRARIRGSHACCFIFEAIHLTCQSVVTLKNHENRNSCLYSDKQWLLYH